MATSLLLMETPRNPFTTVSLTTWTNSITPVVYLSEENMVFLSCFLPFSFRPNKLSVWIIDYDNGSLSQWEKDGTVVNKWGGNLYLSQLIVLMMAAHDFSLTIARIQSPFSPLGFFYMPNSVASDLQGEKIFVGDVYMNRVQVRLKLPPSLSPAFFTHSSRC